MDDSRSIEEPSEIIQSEESEKPTPQNNTQRKRKQKSATVAILMVLAVLINVIWPFFYAVSGYSILFLLVIVIFALPLLPFLLNLAFAYNYVRYSKGSIKSKVLRALGYTLGVAMIGHILGAIVYMISHGTIIRECFDSCSESPLYEGIITNFLVSQVCLLGAYIGILIGALKANTDQDEFSIFAPQRS